MASGERRLGMSRRGMTVLGKIPTPSVPKPINLPSQRLENRGLEPNVEIVPRGTFSWGHAGNLNAAGVSKAGASSPPTGSGAWNGGIKLQGNSTSGNDVGSNPPSSSKNGTRPSSAPTNTTTTAWGSSAKTQSNVPTQSSGFTVVQVDSATSGSKASADSLPQHNDVQFNRPTSADGNVGDLELLPHSGTSDYAGGGPGHVPCCEGLQDPGVDHPTFARRVIPPAGSELPVGAAPHSGPLPQEVLFRSFGIPHYSGPRDRDMVVVRMDNNPGVYESYQPHLTPAECFSRSDGYGSYHLHSRHSEHFAISGSRAAGAGSGAAGMRMQFFPSGNKFLSQEREGFCHSAQDFRMHRDGQFGTAPRDQGYFGLHTDAGDMSSMPIYGNEWNHMPSRNLRKHNHPKEARDFVKEEVPEKKFILLTKTPRVDTQRIENTTNSSILLLDCGQGSQSCEQERELSKSEVDNQSESLSIFSKVKKSDEFFENKKFDGDELGGITREITNLSIAKQDISCSKENPLEVEAGINNLSLAGINTSYTAQKLLTSTASNGKIRNSELKVKLKHDGKADADGHRSKSSKQTRKVPGRLEPVGVGSQPVCEVPTKQIVAEDVAHKDDQRLKIKAFNHKSEKEWRPKSPVVDSVLAANAFSLQAAKGEKISEKNCSQATDGGETSQECSTGSIVVLGAPSLLQNQKARKWRSIHGLSSTVRSGSCSKVEDPSLLVDFNDQQSKIAEGTVDQPTECQNERSTLRDSCSNHTCITAGPIISQAFSALDSTFMETEGLSHNKTRGRAPYCKVEKEWRPKSPAVEVIAANDSIPKTQASEADIISLPVSDNDMKGNYDLKIVEQEGGQALDIYDYEGQRARLKEIASQRAKQLRKEEEERAREQKAKALAKLEELDRRTSVNSTSVEGNEHATLVFMDEASNRKTKKRLNSSKQPSADVPLGDLEKQPIDESSVRDPPNISRPASPMVGNKEATSKDERISHNFRNKRDGFDRNSPKIMEDHQAHEPVSGTSSSKAQRRNLRRDLTTHQEGLPSAQDTEANSFSGKKYGVQKDEAGIFGGSQRQKGAIHNQIGQVASYSGNERKSVLHRLEEQKEPKLSPFVSQSGNIRSISEINGKRRSLQGNAEELKELKLGELLVSGEHPDAFYNPEKNSSPVLSSMANAGYLQQSAADSLQDQGGNMEAVFSDEQVQSFEAKQSMEPIAASNANFVSEKVGRSHASWRQKNSSGHHLPPNSNNSNSSVSRNMQNALEESSDAPTPFRKSYKMKNGGKQSSHVQEGPTHLEGCVAEEKGTFTFASTDSELTDYKATLDLTTAAEVNAIEHGRSQNSRWRQKNGKTGSHASKKFFTRESNMRHSVHLGATDEACEEIIDSIPPYVNNLRVNAKHSPKFALEASQWHKNRLVKPSASSQGQQARSDVSLEEQTLVSASLHPIRSSLQSWDNEHEQESKNHPRKRGLRIQAEAKLHSETSTPNPKHHDMHSMKVAEIVCDPPISGRNRFNHTNTETRKTSRQHQAASQTFRSHDQHQEAPFEHHGEQHSSSRGNKASRQKQFKGCSTVAELDRRDAESAIKTGISY